MRPVSTVTLAVLLSALFLGGCGYSEDEMTKKNAEINDLRSALTAEQAAARKSHDDLASASKQVDDLRTDLKAKGVDISNMNASVEQQARAMEEFKRHTEQIDVIKRRADMMKQRLKSFLAKGVVVTVRQNRLMVIVPADVMFDAGKETLRRDGEAVLTRFADIMRSDPGLSQRVFQVAAHVDGPTSAAFKDGLGLSAMRAREVLAWLLRPTPRGGGLNPSHWSAAGYGDADPWKRSDSADAKRANARVELVLMPGAEEILDLKGIAQ